jgi:hypothetical protein
MLARDQISYGGAVAKLMRAGQAAWQDHEVPLRTCAFYEGGVSRDRDLVGANHFSTLNTEHRDLDAGAPEHIDQGNGFDFFEAIRQ